MSNILEEFHDVNDARIFAENMMATVREPLIVLDKDLRVVFANQAFYGRFQVTKEESEGRLIYDLGNSQWDIPKLREALEKIIPRDSHFDDFEVEHDFTKIGHRIMLLNGRQIKSGGDNNLLLLAIDDVTESVTARRRLQESEEKYRGFVQIINSIIFKFNREGKITFFNRFAEKIFGYTEKELLDKPLVGTIIPEKNEAGADLRGLTQDILADPEKYYFYLAEGRKKDGGRVWFQWSAKEIRDEKGEIQEILGDGNDVTGEMEYRKMLDVTQRLVESSPEIIARFGEDLRLIYGNPQLMLTFGQTKEGAIGKAMRELGLPEENVGEWETALAKAKATKEKVATDIEFNGRAYHIQIMPENDETKSFMVYAADISDRKTTEDLLRRNEYELRTLLDNSPDLVFRIGSTMRYEYVNSAYERLTGLSKEEFIGKMNEELGMPQELVEFWKSSLGRVFEAGREISAEFDFSGFMGKRYFSAQIVPEFAKTGFVDTALVIARDVSKRKIAEEQIRYISYHDEVTGLFNRAFFEEEIRRLDSGRDLPICIIMGDVNNLKISNDVFGHDEGDMLIKTIAEFFRKTCRKDDIMARWGGDEFTVILPRTDFAAAHEVCCRIKQMAKESKGTIIQPSIALGVAAKENKDQNIYQTIRQAEERMYQNKLDESKQAEDNIFSLLFALARERNNGLDASIERSRALAGNIGKELGLSESQIDDLRLLIKLHDIGDAVIPLKIISKSGGLTPEEWEVVKRHPEVGFRIAKTFNDTSRISDEIFSHGERWDGTGYPRNLKEKEIPYLARIFQIIDAFDVMTHGRPYARALTQEEAISELRRNAGKQFDPELTEAFLKALTGAAKEKALI